MSVALGLRAQRGGAVAVALALDAGEPRLLFSTLLETAAAGDRLSLEPYHVAFESPRGPQGKASAEAAAAVAEGRRRQEEIAARNLPDLIRRLDGAQGGLVVAALLVHRANWITDLLDYSLAWREHAAYAEGLAVRDALRSACRQAGIEVIEIDEKSLPEKGAEALGMTSEEIDARLKALGSVAGKPWRKEQRLACLAAWVALGARP